jgi:protease I
MKIIRTWYENEYFYFCSMILRRLMNMSKKIATLITNLFEDVEYTEPVQAFKEAGHEVITIDKQSGNEVTGKKGTTVKIDKSIDEVHPADFDALLIPGGFSPDLLREDDRFGEFAKAFIQDEKPVFAICHGPQVLIDTDLLKGVDITGYKSIRNDLKNAGANFKDEEVVISKNIVTSREPKDIPAFNRESLKLLAK